MTSLFTLKPNLNCSTIVHHAMKRHLALTWSESLMHSPEFALKTLELLRNNYLILGRIVDLELMSSERLDFVRTQNGPIQPLLISAWLSTQGFFISAWAMWEYHSQKLCEGLPNKQSKKNKSHVQWVADTLAANGTSFAEKVWFDGGNAMRHLITHHATRAVGERAEELLGQARSAFPVLHVDADHYVRIGHDHAAVLTWKIEEFIRDPSRTDG
jgi:hypothetical protein